MSEPAPLPEILGIYEIRYENAWTRRIDALVEPNHFVWIDLAWAVMLIKRGIVNQQHVPRIVETLQRFRDDPDPPFIGFGCVEKYVIQQLGVEVGGSLTVGRTIPPLRQMFPVRQKLMKLMTMLFDLQEVLLETAEQHKDAVMPGYTHVRHAQPETFGHYLLSGYDPMDRIMRQIEEGYRMMGLNELGCGALAGTSLPIDRELTSQYLGMEGLIENSNDAVAYTDGYVHLVSALANLMSVWSRMMLDIQYWSGEEYGFLHVPWLRPGRLPQKEGGKGKSHSHFMPNKVDNSPYIERTRVASAELVGQLTEILTQSGRAPQADTHEMLHMIQPTERAIHSVHLYLHVWIHALPRTTVHRERMLETARRGYSCASELANRIMMDHGLDYRTAHEIVNEFVAEARRQNIPASEVPISMLEDAAGKVIGKPLNMTEQALRQALDPEHFVRVTDSQGGTAPQECQRMIDRRRAALKDARQRHEARIEKLEQAKARLNADLDELASAPVPTSGNA